MCFFQNGTGCDQRLIFDLLFIRQPCSLVAGNRQRGDGEPDVISVGGNGVANRTLFAAGLVCL